MADVDDELVERAIRWCAEAGREAAPAHVRAALGALSWAELVAARAVLADPPPSRPLGPFALADIARGAPADVAAERERSGRYGSALAEVEAHAKPAAEGTFARAAVRRGRPPRGGARPPFVVRRAGDRVAAHERPKPAAPLLDELFLDPGRTVMERLLRRHGGRRARIVAALAEGWRRADGAPIGSDDFDRLLTRHGMARAYETRERDELLHAVRAGGGLRATAAAALGLTPDALDAATDRLGVRAQIDVLREQRRRDFRARGTLAQRSHLVLNEMERLADLGLLEEFAEDLRKRLPDHLHALAASSDAPVTLLLTESLSLDSRQVEELARRLGLALEARSSRPPPSTTGGRPPRPSAPPRRAGVKPTPGGARRGAPPAGARPTRSSAPPPRRDGVKAGGGNERRGGGPGRAGARAPRRPPRSR
jgi:hypothetical protein